MRPNAALGASDAPNATLGASHAPNATLGRYPPTNRSRRTQQARHSARLPQPTHPRIETLSPTRSRCTQPSGHPAPPPHPDTKPPCGRWVLVKASFPP
ncbi:hypothetical protein DMP23_03190 [Amycolatopsis sp. A1MSW2902]